MKHGTKSKKKQSRIASGKLGLEAKAQQSALNDDDDPFKTLSEEINALREENPQLLDDRIESEDLVSTDVNVLTSESLTDNDTLAEFQDEDCNNKSDDEPDGEKTAVKLLTPFSDSAFLLTENSRQFSSFILTIFIFRIVFGW